ncbi:uncharacterized protein LOC118647647 [Monomorium pharaonis]|uniref:uncharacterized protein LOC118647647 n=1 Tax=Monomorium pharaonis TaxID=307658 RepID=UPI0017461294|nr:uncharacterized protein LOC118647647 [Monomorium pharaonis]
MDLAILLTWVVKAATSFLNASSSLSSFCDSRLLSSLGAVDVASTTAFCPSSWIRSACSATSSSSSVVRVASMACIGCGRRPSHSVRSSSLLTVAPARALRYLRNCDGFLSPISSRSNSCRILLSCESVSLCISAFFNASYFSVSGGWVIMSFTSRACFGSNFESA